MTIPEQVKVGGKIYDVEVSDRLSLGTTYYTGECLYSELKIRITPQAEQKMQADFLHELMHAIYSHLGYSDHDEKHIEELAEALYMIIQDNPEIFQKDVIDEETRNKRYNMCVERRCEE